MPDDIQSDAAAGEPVSGAPLSAEGTALAEPEHEGHGEHAHDHAGHDHEGHDHEGHDHAEHDHEADDHDVEPEKLTQTVDIRDIGPCKKHIKVSVSRVDIDKRFDEKFAELVGDSIVPGFRPGKAPRQVVIRKFRKDVDERVRGEILLASLEQLADDFDVAPLTPPNLNPDQLLIPEKGDFIYEFEVEVRPTFDLPDFKGLKLNRPVKTFSDAEVEEEERRVLGRYGQLIPKDGPVERGDYVIVDMVTKLGEELIGEGKEITIRADDTVAFKDAVAPKFGEQVLGAKAGETRIADLTMTDSVGDARLRGQAVHATLTIKDVKILRMPEMTEQFLAYFGCKTADQFRERVRVALEKRLEYTQRQSAREQVLKYITAAASWELPQDLLRRQARKAMQRRVMEMRESGLAEEEIEARIRLLQRDVLQSTAASLKEHFVMQKLAEVEKIEVDQDDIDFEIERLAEQSGDSPRKVRAQLEREDLLETVAAQLIERKALDLILDNAAYTDVPLTSEPTMSTVSEQAVPGAMQDPAPAVEETHKPESSSAPEASAPST